MSKRGKRYAADAHALVLKHRGGFVFQEAVRAPTRRPDTPLTPDPPGEYGQELRQLRRNANSAATQLKPADARAIELIRNGGGRAAFDAYFGMIWKFRNHGDKHLRAEGQRLLRVARRYLPEFMPRKGVTKN